MNSHRLVGISFALVIGVLAMAADAMAQRGPGPRFRGGRGPHGHQDQDFRADRDVFRFLLQHHGEIRRTVKKLDNGVETLTESDNPHIAAKIREHVAAMAKRVEQTRPIHRRDPLFDELFRHTDRIRMKYEKSEKGIRVIETSDDPYVAKLIQEHARVVSQFVKNGPVEMHRNHAVPRAEIPVGAGPEVSKGDENRCPCEGQCRQADE